MFLQRGGDKTETEVKARCRFIDWMGEDGPDSGLIGNQQSSPNRVLQHAATDTSPLHGAIHGQPGQNDNRNRITPHPFANALGYGQRIDLADGQAEIAARIEREAVTAIDSDSKTGVRELIYQEAA